MIVKSSFEELKIPEDVTYPEFLISGCKKFAYKAALASIQKFLQYSIGIKAIIYSYISPVKDLPSFISDWCRNRPKDILQRYSTFGQEIGSLFVQGRPEERRCIVCYCSKQHLLSFSLFGCYVSWWCCNRCESQLQKRSVLSSVSFILSEKTVVDPFEVQYSFRSYEVENKLSK